MGLTPPIPVPFVIDGFGAKIVNTKPWQGHNHRMDRDPQVIDKDIDKYGYRVTWEKNMPCPNIPYKETHDPNCELCTDGKLYFDSTDTRMLVEDMNLEQSFYAAGRFVTGVVRIISKYNQPVSIWDRITLTDCVVEQNNELIRRKGGNLTEKLRYEAISVHYAYTVLGGALTALVPGTDFEISASDDRSINWLRDVVPPNTFFSIWYMRKPSYIVLDMLHWIRGMTRMDNGQVYWHHLPRYSMGRLDFLVFDHSRESPDQYNDVDAPGV